MQSDTVSFQAGGRTIPPAPGGVSVLHPFEESVPHSGPTPVDDSLLSPADTETVLSPADTESVLSPAPGGSVQSRVTLSCPVLNLQPGLHVACTATP